VLGTLVGMTPGVVGITVFEAQLEEMIHDPSGVTLAILAAVLTLLLLGAALLRRWLRVGVALREERSAAPEHAEHYR
jgi:hypothetical protein